MKNFAGEYEEVLATEKLTIGQLWDNQPPVMHWCLGLTCFSFGFIYMLLFTML